MNNNEATLNKHRESIVNPGEYTHVAEFYQGPSEEMQEAFASENAYLDQLVGGDWSKIEFHRNGGCAHCGSHFNYGSVFSHEVHGFVALGHTCAGERFSVDSNIALRSKLARKRGDAKRKNAKAAAKFLESLSSELLKAFETDHYIVKDILRKGKKYGSISERQGELVLKIAREEAEKAAAKVEAPVVEEEKMVPVPESDERVTVVGEVLMTRYEESNFSYYGGSLKMLLKVNTPDGFFKLWGTCPAAVDEAVKGDKIQFVARLVRSDRDESFGFYKNPRKAVIV